MKQLWSASLCAVFLAASANGAYEIQLGTGWNLVSLPEQQTNPDIEIVTRSLQGKVTAIWSYESGQWSGYFPGQAASTLSRMDAGRAYWIFMAEAGSLVGAGLKPASALSLDNGWNFVGFNATAPKTPSEVFGGDLTALQAIYSHDGGNWRTFVPGGTNNTLTTLSPGKGYWIQTRTSVTANFGYALNTRLRMLDDATLRSITAFSDTAITVSAAQASGVAVGDLVSGGVSSRTPDGFMRRVSAITSSGGSVTWTTSAVGLPDAVQDGVIGMSMPISSPAVAAAMQAQLLPGERAEYVERERAALSTGGTFSVGAIKFTLNRTLTVGSAGSVTLSGEVYFEPQLIVNMEFSGFRLRSMRAAAQGREHVQVAISATGNTPTGNLSVPLGEIPLPTLTFFLGPVPIVFGNKIEFTFNLSGSVGVGGLATATQSASALLGVQYIAGQGFSPINNWENTFSLGSQNGVQATFSATVGAALKFKLYGVAGPYLGFYGGAELNAQTSLNANTWGVDLVLGGEVGFEIGSRTLTSWGLSASANYSYPFEVYRKRLFPSSSGTVAGLVVDSNGPLAGVTVMGSKGGVAVGSPTTTTSTGSYSLSLSPQSDYLLTLSKSGYASRTVSAVEINSGQVTSVPQVFMDTSNAVGTIRGAISNASTGTGVPNALVTLRPGLRTTSPEAVGITAFASTDSSGRYTVTDLQPGYYTGVVTAAGYIQGSFTALARGGSVNDNQNGTVSPSIDGSTWRVVLTWGANPRDLDSHLTGPISGSASRFEVAYYSRGSVTSSPYASLDVDQTSGFGPETVTIARTLDGTYRYYVYHYAGFGSLATSGARVAVYRGNSLQKTYSVPNQSGEIWTVFEIRNGVLTDINAIGNVFPAASADDEFIANDFAKDRPTLWTNQPPKYGADMPAPRALR